MNRLLVIGAGATIEECKRSGNFPNDPDKTFPTIKNFCKKFFSSLSGSLLFSTASYLLDKGVPFDTKFINISNDGKIEYSKILNLHDGDKITDEDLARSPIGVFVQMEEEKPDVYNIERLCEFAWNSVGNNESFWQDFAHLGIYEKMQWLFYFQFGSGLGRPMMAGTKVASKLNADDVVINLNYDIAFDLALKQAGKNICYAPNYKVDSVRVLKPHGSMNLYVNLITKEWFFSEPDKISGSAAVTIGDKGLFHPDGGIIPPRLNKNYKLHPIATDILNVIRFYTPQILTFWGIGLTESDVDLLSIYRNAAKSAKVIEFINPDEYAVQKARKLIGRKIRWFPTLDDWFSKYNIS